MKIRFIERLIMDKKERRENNLLLLEKLKAVLAASPDLRFIQALFAMRVIDQDKNGNIVDRFYEEPCDTLNRIANKG